MSQHINQDKQALLGDIKQNAGMSIFLGIVMLIPLATALAYREWSASLHYVAGIGVAFLTLARVIRELLHDEPEVMSAVFLGLVAGSVVIAWRLIRQPLALHAALIAIVLNLVLPQDLAAEATKLAAPAPAVTAKSAMWSPPVGAT